MKIPKIIDISLELDARNFAMRTYAGFRKDMQFEVEVIKEYADPGLGQIVRGVHMRLHAGSHVDAPAHMVEGGKELQDLPIDTFIGDALIADVTHRVPGQGITAKDLEDTVGEVQPGERVLLRSNCNNNYDGGSNEWQKRSPYLEHAAVHWFVDKKVSVVGFDCYHGADAPRTNIEAFTARTLQENGICTMPYLKNLDQIQKKRVTLVALPLKMIGVEASPVRAIVLEE
jgi:arylformamidase